MSKPRILIVDDEIGFTRMIKIVLQNYDIQEENDARQAHATALAFRPELILLDVVMPGIDGGNLALTFRADAQLKDVPIIFLTAVVSLHDAGVSSQLYGGYPFLAKPVTREDLEQCIEQHLPAK
jgi:CheY-like chemotaxis protein